MSFTELAQFAKFAQYLVNPFVLVGLGIFLFFGIHGAILKANILSPISAQNSNVILRLMLRYGFWIAVLMLLFGFAYAGMKTYRDAESSSSKVTITESSITQSAGNCGSNVIGNNNKSSANCEPSAKKPK